MSIFPIVFAVHTEEVKITPGNGDLEVPIWIEIQQSKTNILLHVVDFVGEHIVKNNSKVNAK
ncbi:hypothetical protein HYD72_00915 [Mycoplasmopsis bovis]|nr:hypothetical protein [Mycoplasmopsis bovis]QQH49243.1 hypothetical protein HYD72_00915 [Mycoplasmopsis bovis]